MKKKVVAALMCLTMAMSLAACGGGSGSSGGESASKGDSKDQERVVELWTCWTDGADTQIAGTEQIKKFEEETGVKVNQTNFTYDMLHEKILTAAAGGNVPDLIWGLPEYVGEFYNMGIVEDLTNRFNEWENKDALSEAVVKAMTIDDKIVGIPYEMTVRAYLTHEKDITAAGIEVPETWEDLLAQTDYKEKNGKYLTELACTGVRSAQELLVYLAQYDLEIASAQDDGKYKNTWKDNKEELDKAAKVFQFYKDLVDQGIIDPNCKNWGWEETDENFATGITSTYVSGNWLAERESSNPDTMDDVDRVLLDAGEIQIESARAQGEKVNVRGKLDFRILYRKADGGLQTLAGSIPFEESVNVPGLEERDYTETAWELDDLSVGMINSRKLSVKALVTLTVQTETLRDVEAAVDIEGAGSEDGDGTGAAETEGGSSGDCCQEKRYI